MRLKNNTINRSGQYAIIKDDISKIQKVDKIKTVSNNSEESTSTNNSRYDNRPNNKTEEHKILTRDREE